MAEEKHRMLYQGQEPCQIMALSGVSVVRVAEPPPYDDAIMMMPSYASYNFNELAERRSTLLQEQLPLDQIDGQQQQQEMEQEPLEEEQEYQSMEQVDQEQQHHKHQQMAVHRVSLPYLLLGRFALPRVRNFFQQPKLGDIAIPIRCPACGQNGLTRLERSPNTRTHTWALWLCSFGWCCCACFCPYFMNCCRTTNHYCSNCQIYLGAYYPSSCFHQ
ncbi:forkhead box protein P2 [Drosophila willistoni]|uniref:forkhead box protein P2 n=1 Tax=Drosophila willistoni TaxID=7260 RepID=UPI001F0759D6|nr:forkhead box protein P2 [Drosophila willistoni]